MGGLFSKPKVSKPKPAKLPTDPADTAAKQRNAEDEEARRKRAALASNVLGASGAESSNPIGQKTTLGG